MILKEKKNIRINTYTISDMIWLIGYWLFQLKDDIQHNNNK